MVEPLSLRVFTSVIRCPDIKVVFFLQNLG